MYHQRRVRKGFGSDVAVVFLNAAMQAIYKSNVRFADWVKRHACRGSGQKKKGSDTYENCSLAALL
jgi:hypothetical protein